MADMRFDTEKMVERLENAGVAAAQARAHVSLLTNSINATEESIIERCSSKQEVGDNVALIRADFERLRSHFDSELEKQRSELEKQRQHFDNELEKQRQHFDAELEKMRLDFQAQLSKTRSDLILMAGTAGIVQLGLITALILKLIP